MKLDKKRKGKSRRSIEKKSNSRKLSKILPSFNPHNQPTVQLKCHRIKRINLIHHPSLSWILTGTKATLSILTMLKKYSKLIIW